MKVNDRGDTILGEGDRLIAYRGQHMYYKGEHWYVAVGDSVFINEETVEEIKKFYSCDEFVKRRHKK